MRMDYGPVELQILKINRILREIVWDDSRREAIGVDWTLDVIGIINPRATTYTRVGGGAPTILQGQRAELTDDAIREAMCKPRQTLLVRPVGREFAFLRSPMAGYTCDLDGGPYPLAFNVLDINGDKTMVVHFRIRTRMPICIDTTTGRHPLVLAHRWRQRLDTDVDNYAVRITEGVVNFSMAELVRRNVQMDQFRRDFAHAEPDATWKREHGSVTASEQGNVAWYTVVDRERSHVLNSVQGLTRIEAYHTEHVRRISPMDVLMKAGVEFIGGGFGVGFGGAIGAVGSILKGDIKGIGNIADKIMGVNAKLAGYAISLIPRATSHMFVRGWGDRQSSRANIGQVVMGVAVGRIASLFQLARLPGIETSFTKDLDGKFAEFQLSLVHPIGPLSVGGAIPVDPAWRADNETVTIGGVEGLLRNDSVTITPASAPAGKRQPRFPRSAGFRGTFAGNLVVSALGDPCELIIGQPANFTGADFAFPTGFG